MKRLSAVIGAILLAVSPTVVQAHDINQPAAMMPGPVYEYVQQAASLQSDGQSMTLQGVSPSTIFFSDRPYRLAGQIETTAFARFWEADGTFAQSPPNAAVSVLGSADTQPAIVELTSATVSGDSIKYGIKVLAGTLPETGKNVALFVDHARNVHTTAAGGVHAYPYHPVPGPYCYHAPQAPECHYHPYHPYYPPYYPPYYHPGAAFAAGAVVGAAAASANQPQYVYPIPAGPIPAQCYINSNHTRMICSVPIQQ